MPARPTYWDYIRVEDLLSLQTGIDGDEAQLTDDEVRFIAIHQIDELWFKLALRELTAARDLFRAPHVPETALSAAALALRRVTAIFDLAARHFGLMETMRTRDYLRFRDKLSPASGFQSAQFREIEILLGLDPQARIPLGTENSFTDALRESDGSASPALRRIERRLADRPTLRDAVYAWLARTPIHSSSPSDPGDDEAVGAFLAEFLACHRKSMVTQMQTALDAQALTAADRERLEARYAAEAESARHYLEADDIADPALRAQRRRMRAAILFLDSHRELPLLSWPAEIVDLLIELEQSLLVFRQRHARMVERVIGRRVGTGGSEGVDYLDQTALRYRVFAELWAARTLLLRPDAAPPLRNADLYGLRLE